MTTTTTYNRVDPNGLTFGVEIETHIPATTTMHIGSWHSSGGQQSDHVLPSCPRGGKWKVQRDGSIQTPRGRVGAEFISPVLKGEDGLRHLLEMVRVMKAETTEQVPVSHRYTANDHLNSNPGVYSGKGAKINASCGVHVHVGLPANADIDLIKRICAIVAGFERGLYAATGTKNRERGRYCRPIKDTRGYRAIMGKGSIAAAQASRAGEVYTDRYFGLNLSNFLLGRMNTVEFRMFSASLNPIKIAAFVQIALGIVQLAMQMPRAARWDGKATPKPEQAPAIAEMERLIARLGWNGKKRLDAFRNVGVLGEGDGLPTRRQMMKQLRRLAERYAESEQDAVSAVF